MCEVNDLTVCGSGTVWNHTTHTCDVNSTHTPSPTIVVESTHNQCEDGTYSNANTCFQDGARLNSSTTCVCADGSTVNGSQCVVGPIGCTSGQFWDHTSAICVNNEFNIRFGSEQYPCDGSLVEYATTSFSGDVKAENHQTNYRFGSLTKDELSIWLPSDSKLRFSKRQTDMTTVVFNAEFDFRPDNNEVPDLKGLIRSPHCHCTNTNSTAYHQCGGATGYKCSTSWAVVSNEYDYTRPASHYYVSCVN